MFHLRILEYLVIIHNTVLTVCIRHLVIFFEDILLRKPASSHQRQRRISWGHFAVVVGIIVSSSSEDSGLSSEYQKIIIWSVFDCHKFWSISACCHKPLTLLYAIIWCSCYILLTSVIGVLLLGVVNAKKWRYVVHVVKSCQRSNLVRSNGNSNNIRDDVKNALL